MHGIAAPIGDGKSVAASATGDASPPPFDVPVLIVGELLFNLPGLPVAALGGLEANDTRLALGLMRKFGVLSLVGFALSVSAGSNLPMSSLTYMAFAISGPVSPKSGDNNCDGDFSGASRRSSVLMPASSWVLLLLPSAPCSILATVSRTRPLSEVGVSIACRSGLGTSPADLSLLCLCHSFLDAVLRNGVVRLGVAFLRVLGLELPSVLVFGSCSASCCVGVPSASCASGVLGPAL